MYDTPETNYFLVLSPGEEQQYGLQNVAVGDGELSPVLNFERVCLEIGLRYYSEISPITAGPQYNLEQVSYYVRLDILYRT